MIRTPLKSGDLPVGNLYAKPAAQRRLTEEEQRLLAAFAEQLQVAVERARLQRVEIQTEVLRRTDELRVALLSAVAHDLRSPLGSIKTAASGLLNPRLRLPAEDREEFLRAIVAEVDHINSLVSNLLDMSRIEAGTLRPQKEPHRIEEVISTVLERLQPRLDRHPVDTHIEGDLPAVPFDAVEIDEVLTNLLENAIKHTPEGTPIHVCARRAAGDTIEVCVSDEGPGVPPDEMTHLFDRFYRVTSGAAAGVQGTGLGLAIAKGIVEAHKGQIRAANRPEGGMSFSFTLPV